MSIAVMNSTDSKAVPIGTKKPLSQTNVMSAWEKRLISEAKPRAPGCIKD